MTGHRDGLRLVMSVDRLGAYGGVELTTTEVAKELARRGHHVHLLYRELVNAAPDAELACASVTWVPEFDVRLKRPISALRRVSPSVRASLGRRPEVIYVNRFEELPFAIPAGLLGRAPVVCHLHYFTEHRALRAKGAAVSRFIAVSKATASQWMSAGLDGRRIDVIPNGVDMAAFPLATPERRAAARRALGLPPDCLVVLYCGRVHGEKGVDVLIEAWERLGLHPEEARLVVVGAHPGAVGRSGYEAELMARRAPGVDWHPATRDVVPALHAADVLAVPSRHESFGRVIVEAMATGLPVVGTRVGGIPETMRGLDGFLVDPDDPAGLGRRLLAVARRRVEEPGLAATLRSHVVQRFTLERSMSDIEQVLKEAA